MSLIQKNLELLQADCSFSQSLAVMDESPVYFEDKTPFKCAFFRSAGKNFPMQSMRRPEEEAERIAGHWLKDKCSEAGIYILVGISSMHLIVKCLEKLDDHSELLVIEPSPSILRSFLENNDLEDISGFKTALTFFCPQTENPAREFRNLIKEKDLLCKAVYISPANKRFRPQLTEMQHIICKQIQLEGMDRVTTAKFADEWLQNCIINLPETAVSPGIKRLYGKFPETDCLVICAGPSLNDSLEIIKKKQHSCFIICVGTALKPLLQAGIKPDLTIVVDSDPKVYKQFEGLKEIPGYLLAAYTIFPGIYQHFKKAFCFDCVVTTTFSEWLAGAQIEHGSLNVGGTVALSALDCALKLNFRKNFIFGLDLAYAEDGTSHAKNSMYEGHKANFGLVEIPGNWNKTVKTTKQFANYVEILKGYLREHIAGSCGKFFNINNDGAKIDGLNTLKPEEAAELIQDSKQNFKELLSASYICNEKCDIEDLCLSSIEELNEINAESTKLLEEMHQGDLPESLKDFEEKVKNSDVNIKLTEPAMQAWCMSVTTKFENDPIEMTKNFLTQLSGSTEWVSGLLKNSYKRFQKINKGVQHGT